VIIHRNNIFCSSLQRLHGTSMTGVLGALWTTLQNIGWLLCFLRQLISDTLNINYRLVSALGHLIAAIAKILYALFNSLSLAVYEAISYVLLATAGTISFVIDCLYFLTHCCALLFKVIYYTVTGVADGIFFVVLMPICACHTIHSWITWIFNAERWMNATAYCFRTCGSAFLSVEENTWWLILYLVTTVSCWTSAVATFACELTTLCCTAYNGFFSLCAGINGCIAFLAFQLCSFILLPLYFVGDYLLAVLENLKCGLLQLCATAHFMCLIPISASLSILLVMLCFHRNQLTRLLPRFLQHSTRGEVIHIHFNDVDDVIDMSDDEQDHLRGRAANVYRFPADDTDEDDEESVIADSSDEVSDDTSISSDATVSDISDSDNDDSDAEPIEVQLPDQPMMSPAGRRQHGYATRSKGNTEQFQQNQEQECEPALCVICQDQPKSVLVLPCRHMCMCIDCARTVVSGTHSQRRICPLCRGNIRIIMNVYT